MTEIWIALALVLTFLAGLPIVVGGVQLAAFARVRVTLMQGSKGHRLQEEATRQVGELFIDTAGFLPAGAYEVSTPVASANAVLWQLGDEPTYLAVLMVSGSIGTDFVTVFSWERGIGVTTGTRSDGHTAPKPPDSWMQTFSNLPIDGLWARHLEAEAALAEHYGMSIQPLAMSPAQVLEESLKRDAWHVISHPWLLAVVTWRFWIGRHLLHGRSVADRLEPGRSQAF